MRALLAAVMFVVLAADASAQSKDSSERMLGIDMNRDKAENRIERLHDNKDAGDKARAEKVTPPSTKAKKKPTVVPKQ